MAATGEKTTRTNDDGTTQEVLNVEFTNGGIKQLEELKQYFNKEDLVQVVQLGIAYLQRLKEVREQSEKEKVEEER